MPPGRGMADGGGARRARGRGRAAALAALGLGGVLGGTVARGAVGAGGGFLTPEGYDELPPAEACREGCESLRMSGKELFTWWKEHPEGGKSWSDVANPFQKMMAELGDIHMTDEMLEIGDRAIFDIALLIFDHLADLEDEVEAAHERETGVPAGEASREEKHLRLFEAYMDESAPLEYEGHVLDGLGWGENAEYFRAMHVNQFHQMTGYLQWPHYDWRPVPEPALEPTCDLKLIPVMFINLASRADRRKELKDKMPKEVPYSIVDAVEGASLDLSEIGTYRGFAVPEGDPITHLVPNLLMRYIDTPHLLSGYWSRDVSPGEVGLVLSLKKVFDRAQAEGFGSVLVLEDDNVVVPGLYCTFLDEFARLQESGIEWDYILLESFNWWGDDASSLPEGLGPYFTRAAGAYNTHAVMYSARGMKRIKDSGFFDRCIMALDDYLSYMANPGRHTRRDFQDCLGPGDGTAPERFVGLRWRGPRVVEETDSSLVSSIDDTSESEIHEAIERLRRMGKIESDDEFVLSPAAGHPGKDGEM